MRSEKEMFELILGVAKSDERIRAVYMNGSRTNPNVEKDKYQDYDIVYVVTETATFLEDKNWINIFGDIAMVQEPDFNDLQTGYLAEQIDISRSYTWLMLFKDGNRIDLHIEIIEEALVNVLADKLTVVLLDKDKLLPEIPCATDAEYCVKKPTEGQYFGCCNEFWWCLNNVAKGIARDELTFAMEMYNKYVRDMLNRMIEWYIGVHTDFSVSTGKMGKYFKKYLPKQYYEQLKQTYCDSDYEHFWNSVFAACELFRILAKDVADNLDYKYNNFDDENMMAYMTRVKHECKREKK